MDNKITFPELIELLAKATNTSKRMSELFLKELFATISQSLIEGESVTVKNLGTFSLEQVKSRKSVSVNTGQEVQIPSHNKVVFTPDKVLADAVNQPFAQFEPVILDDGVTLDQLAAIDAAGSDSIGAMDSIDSGCAMGADEEPPVSAEPLVTPPPFVEPQTPVQPEVPVEPSEPSVPPESSETSETSESLEPTEDDGIDILDIEREKREIARKSFVRGLAIGLVSMLAVALIAVAVWLFCMRGQKHKIVEDRQPVEGVENVQVPAVDSTATQPAEDNTPVVTDTCTATLYLTRMARKHYGDKAFWVYIYEENKDKIDDPNNVAPGTVLVIPPREKYGIDPDDKQSVKTAKEKAYKLFKQFSHGK